MNKNFARYGFIFIIITQLLFIIFPNQFFVKWNINDYIKKYPGKKCKENFSYNSFDNKNFLSVKNLRDILQSF